MIAYSSCCSIQIYFLPNFFATTLVVQLHKKGSKTISHSLLLAKMIFASSFSGFCVGCVVFSGILQKGILMSVHIFEGIVNLKFHSLSVCRSFAIPSSFLYGAMTFFFILTCSILNVYCFSFITQKYISSMQFFQFELAHLHFSLSRVILLIIEKYFLIILKTGIEDFRSQQMYIDAFFLAILFNSHIHNSSHVSYSSSYSFFLFCDCSPLFTM